MSSSKKRNRKVLKNKQKKMMLINTWGAGFVVIGSATTTGVLCSQGRLGDPITTTELSVLLSGYTNVGNFKTTPDFMGVLEQLKQNMMQGGATNVISINDVQLRVGTWNAGSGCVIEPKNASVQYTGSATLSWTVSSKKLINTDLITTIIPETDKFNGVPTAAMILKKLKSLTNNGNMQLNQLDAVNIICIPGSSVGTGTADIVPTAHSVVYIANDQTTNDKVPISFSYISEPVELSTIINTTNLGNFDEMPSSADVFGRMFNMNTTADTMFDPADLNLTRISDTAASVTAVNSSQFLGTVYLGWTINNRINIQSVFTTINCGYFIVEPTSFDIWTRAKTLNYTTASSLIPDELTWDILYNSVNISVQIATSKATMMVINTSTRFYGTVEFTWILDTRTDIHDLIPNVMLGNIPATGGTITESQLKTAVENANQAQTIIWTDLTITIDQEENEASIAPNENSSNYSGTSVTVFYNAISVGNSTGTDWEGWVSGTVATTLTITKPLIPNQVVGTAAITNAYAYNATNLLIPDYIMNGAGPYFYKVITINSTTFNSSKATLIGILNLGNSIETIGGNAFSGQATLTGELFIPNSVQKIGDISNNNAFWGCTGLTFGSDSSAEIKYTSVNATHIHKWCLGFITATRTESVVAVSGGTFGIAAVAFDGGASINTLTLPSGLSNIGSYAIKGCDGLNGSTITIPSSVTAMNDMAFKYTGGNIGTGTGLKIVLPIAFDNPTTWGNQLFYSSNIIIDDTLNPGKLMIPKNVVSLGQNLFSNSTRISGNIYIPNTVKYVDANPFGGTISGITWDTTTNPGFLCSFADEPDYGLWIKTCTSDPVGTLSMPTETRGILYEAFKDKCTNVSSINLPTGLTNIGGYAFAGTMSGFIQASLIIPNSVTQIGQFSFASTGFENTAITLPNNLEYLINGAFSGSRVHSFIGNFTLANPPRFTGSIVTQSTIPGTVTNNGDGYTSQELLDYLKTYCSLPATWTAT